MFQQLLAFVHNTPTEVLYSDVIGTVLAVERAYVLAKTSSRGDLLRRARAALAAFTAPAQPPEAPKS